MTELTSKSVDEPTGEHATIIDARAVERRVGARRGALMRQVPADYSGLMGQSRVACRFLKLFSNESRLQILCLLSEGEKSVGEIERELGFRQAAISQQLGYLRAERVVTARREGKSVFYRLEGDKARRVLDAIHEVFCSDGCCDSDCAMQRVR